MLHILEKPIMTEKNRQFDEVDPHIPAQLRKDLRSLFEPPGRAPQQVDKAILEPASRRLARPRRLIIPLRWAAVAAAAAVVALAAILFIPQSAIRNLQSTRPVLADLDGNGRVDILDAFRLARRIESHNQIQTTWDFNRDGSVDRKDVDIVAFAAVRLNKGV
jgi:hypothetical protein